MDGGAEVAMLMLSDASLDRLAGELGNEWHSLGIYLGVPKAQVDQCFINRPSNVRAATVDMLVMWRQETSEKGPKAQVADLVQALNEIGRVDLAEKVEDGDFIGHPDQGAGNRKYPYQEAGNRAEATGGRNIIIQTGDNANISLPAPFTGRGAAAEGYGAAASAMPTPGYTSLPDLSRMQPPRHMPRAFSQDGIQHSQEDILEDCIRKLQEMGFADHRSMRHYRQEVQNLISTGLNPQAIVQTIVERKTQEHEETSGQRSSPHTVHSSQDGITVSNNEGPVQIGKGNIIRGDLDPRSLDKAVQIGEKNSILPHWAENQNLARKHDRRSPNQQQSFPTQPQQGRFMDDSTVGESTSLERNRRLVEHLPQDRAAGQMAREVPPSDGQDWPPIPENVSSSSEESEVSVNNPGESSTFDSLDGSTPTNKAPLYVALPEEKSPSISSMAEMELGNSQQNPGGSPSRSTDESLSDESLRLQSGGNMQDNLASNRPEAGIHSSADDGDDVPVRPLGDLYPESSRTMPALLDRSIPSIGQQWPPLSPLPVVQQNTVNAQALQSDRQLSQKQEDETIGGVEEPSNLSKHQPTEQVETTDVRLDDVSTSDEETLPKAPLEDASANEAATAEPASDQLHPAETREQVEEGADGAGDQPVYDTERRLYIFSRAHIEKMTENFSPSKKIADGAFGPVYFLERFPYDVDGPSQDRPLKDRPLAIKVNRSEDQGPREFKQELGMAGYRHPHILPLIGICKDEGCLALIYAYMDNKDLLTHMKDQAQRPLNYKQRLLISLDLISAVLYYHRIKRFHRDIKSANVLLDGNYRARLGDSGLMRERPRNKSHLSHTGHSAARCGTTHYQDPYYVENGQFHETSDTFSAGKVLLELLTGKPADAVDKDGFVLFHNWCHQQRYRYFLDDTGKRLCEVADHSDEGWPKVTEDGKSVTQRFAKLIVGCLQSHPTDRINLEVLYQELKDLAKTAGVLGTFSAVMPTVCTYCLACKPCSIPMSCGCVSVCVACMKKNSGALYCTNHHTETTGLGQNTFAVLVGMKGKKMGEQGFGKDAEEMYKVLTDPNICAVRPENVKLLTNGKGTSENIKKAVKELGEEMNKVPESQQKCLLYYHSGHGENPLMRLKCFLLFEDKRNSSTEMRKLFKEICPTTSLYILDVCFASAVQLQYMNKEDEQPVAVNTDQVNEGGLLKWAKDLILGFLPAWLTRLLPTWIAPEQGQEEEQEEEQEDGRVEDLAEDKEKASENFLKPFIPQGSLLWASSRGDEESQVEKSATAEDKISVFTKHILAGLRGGDKSLKDKTHDLGGMPLNFLQDYVFDEVKKEVGDKQTPSISGQDEKTYWIAYPPED